MSGYKIKPPDQKECERSDVFKERLLVKEHVAPAPEEKIGESVGSTFPINNRNLPRDLHGKFLEQIDGNVLVFAWEEFVDCSRDFATIYQFLSNFESCYTSQFSFEEEMLLCMGRVRELFQVR